MAEPFLSEIRIMSFQFAPKGWALCNGQLLPINQNQALFSLLGTTYGGDGRVNFALPDLRGRVPTHMGGGYVLGQRGGEQAHTLSTSEMPLHTHQVNASTGVALIGGPGSKATFGQSSGEFLYASASKTVNMAASSVTSAGGSQPHENMQPYLTVSFCIALQGIFPAPN
jgi:microcystin-dependent protein